MSVWQLTSEEDTKNSPITPNNSIVYNIYSKTSILGSCEAYTVLLT